MSWTKREIIQSAFYEIGMGNYVDILPATQLDQAKKRLDSMAALWQSQGLIAGYPVYDNPADSNVDEESHVRAEGIQALYKNMAVNLAPVYGKVVLPDTKKDAKEAYDQLVTRAAIPDDMQFPDTTPAGGGNRERYSFEQNYLDSTTDPVTIKDINAVIQSPALTLLGDNPYYLKPALKRSWVIAPVETQFVTDKGDYWLEFDTEQAALDYVTDYYKTRAITGTPTYETDNWLDTTSTGYQHSPHKNINGFTGLTTVARMQRMTPDNKTIYLTIEIVNDGLLGKLSEPDYVENTILADVAKIISDSTGTTKTAQWNLPWTTHPGPAWEFDEYRGIIVFNADMSEFNRYQVQRPINAQSRIYGEFVDPGYTVTDDTSATVTTDLIRQGIRTQQTYKSIGTNAWNNLFLPYAVSFTGDFEIRTKINEKNIFIVFDPSSSRTQWGTNNTGVAFNLKSKADNNYNDLGSWRDFAEILKIGEVCKIKRAGTDLLFEVFRNGAWTDIKTIGVLMSGTVFMYLFAPDNDRETDFIYMNDNLSIGFTSNADWSIIENDMPLIDVYGPNQTTKEYTATDTDGVKSTAQRIVNVL